MKSLAQFIFEELNTYQVNDLEIKFDCFPNKEYIQFYLPDSYSEDNFLIYLGDCYFNDLPAAAKNAEKLFGKNASKIYDVYFEYDRYEKGVESKGDFIDWQKDKDTNHDPENEEFAFVQVKDLKYVIKFESFELNAEDSENIPEALKTIFTPCNANETNKFALGIKFNEKNITYTE